MKSLTDFISLNENAYTKLNVCGEANLFEPSTNYTSVKFDDSADLMQYYDADEYTINFFKTKDCREFKDEINAAADDDKYFDEWINKINNLKKGESFMDITGRIIVKIK